MKRFCLTIFLLILLRPGQAQTPVSLEEFKKKSSLERAQIIADAPATQKDELDRIHAHLIALDRFGDEQTLKWWKENAVSNARGFVSLNRIYSDYLGLWNYYLHEVSKANKKARQSLSQRMTAYEKIEAEKLISIKRIDGMHNLVFQLAVSPQATDLEKQASLLRLAFRREMSQGKSNSYPSLKKEDLVEAGKQIDRLVEQLKELPALTPTQSQQEYDTFPESGL